MAKITKHVTYETTSYSSFKRINGNRNVNENNVKHIIKNIRENGLKPTIVICNEKMEIIDGQHRVEALKRLGLPVLYQVHNGLGLADCVAMNITVSKWNNKDYVDSYSELGNENYIELNRLAELYPMFSKNNIACIINCLTTGGIAALIKSGNLKLIHRGKFAEERLNYIKEICENLPNFTGRKECLLTTLARLSELPSVDKVRLKEQCEKYGSSLNGIVDIRTCLIKLEEIYNYKKQMKVRFISAYYETYEDTFNPNRKKGEY